MRSSWRALYLGLLLFPSVVSAAVVHVPYSGQVTNAGTPLQGTYLITVSLYDGGGAVVHTQSASLPLDQGIFHLDLLVDDSVLAANDSLWVGVSVEGRPEMSPRVRIGAVPYAVRALIAPAGTLPVVAYATSFPGVGVPATSTWTAVAQVSLNAPAAGQTWVTATGSWQEGSNTLPNYVGVEFVVGEGTPPIIDERQQFYGFFQYREWPFSDTNVLPAGAGPHTYTLWARVTYVSGTLAQDPTFLPATMQALWLPSASAN